MTTTIIVNGSSDDEKQSHIEHHHLLRPPLPIIFKQFPQSIIQSIETNRRRHLPHARSTSDVLNIDQSSIDDDLDETIASNKKRSLYAGHTRRVPSKTRLILYPDVCHPRIEVSPTTEMRGSVPSLIESKSPKQTRTESFRRNFLDRRLSRRMHSTFSSSLTLLSFGRRRSQQNLPQNSNRGFYLTENSKWHFVRNHLTDIAMMNESYARRKVIEQDLRWIYLRELICKQVIEMREMSILRQQYEGTLKKSSKINLELKAIPNNEVVHIERDGQVYSIGTRDLVLGRLIGDDDIQLDTFAQLDARRRFQIKQSLLKQQEGRARLKKHIAFSFCLCNLSIIALMFAAMFIFVMKTVIALRSREFF
jgi:hypothetical protein